MRRKLPPWAMGLGFAPLGFYFGYISMGLPQLLANRNVPVGTIDEISAFAFAPTFWAFLLCPILDVKFAKKAYCFLFVAIAAICLAASLLSLDNLVLFKWLVMVGCVATVIFGNAIAGWLADVLSNEHYDTVGAWSNVANLGAAGGFGALAAHMMRMWRPGPAATVLSAILLAPLALLLFIPTEALGTRGVAEVFGSFFRDLWTVVRKRGSLLGLLCFLTPAGSFALTNIFSGMGKDFHVSAQWMEYYGPAVAVVCSVGCLISIWLCKRARRRTVYLTAGFGGAAMAITMIFTPHTFVIFAVCSLAYNFFQGINYTAFSAWGFEIVGPKNPLSGTQMGLLAASANLPICYMTWMEGKMYAAKGIPGMFGLDATMSIVVGASLLTLFAWLGQRQRIAQATA